MKITKSIIIDRSTDKVWSTFVDDFENAYQWMSGVTHSHRLNKADIEAPITGRVCKLDENADSFHLVERIKKSDKKNLFFEFEVLPQNAPKLLPVNKMSHKVELIKISNTKTEVLWTAIPDLKFHGKLLSPVLFFGFGQFFGQILKELKHYTETGKPHPKKIRFDLKSTQKKLA